MRALLIILILILIAAVAYILFKESSSRKVSNPAPASSEKAVESSSVNISDFAFTPEEITVLAGTAISFTNSDKEDHTVTADNGKFDQSLNAGQSATITVAEPGVYKYHCKIHPSMTGTITVQ